MIRIGISGWIYPGWRGRFYPEGLPHRCELHYASRRFATIEINGTFYSLKTPQTFRRWAAETPSGFIFAVKGGRFITHMKRLSDVAVPLANFFASGVLTLGEKLGPILWQLPRNFGLGAGGLDRIARFLELLPRDGASAARLAARHDRWMKGRVALPDLGVQPIRHALEVRHESFRDQGFLELMRRAGVALVVSDAPAWPRFEEITADFMYIRLHGGEELYASGYDARALQHWADRIREWSGAQGKAGKDGRKSPVPASQEHDVFVYFDNDAKALAPPNAEALGQISMRTNMELSVSAARQARPRARAGITARSRSRA